MTPPIPHILRQIRELVTCRASLALLPLASIHAIETWCLEQAAVAPPRVYPALVKVGSAMAARTLADVHVSHVDTLLTYLASTGGR